MKKVVLMALALGLSLPAMAIEVKSQLSIKRMV